MRHFSTAAAVVFVLVGCGSATDSVPFGESSGSGGGGADTGGAGGASDTGGQLSAGA
jgi:hypothetical protein